MISDDEEESSSQNAGPGPGFVGIRFCQEWYVLFLFNNPILFYYNNYLSNKFTIFGKLFKI